ncbi:Mitochondrial substrate/solute carrier [Corchorus olitorius]|uniref:Mitochondrial substrate/solute carrier n=1 Tax=Corchorus olitorius TaxID=93759 RepID=A0A1R3FWG4_9ROSI|nr:Mitochondrial substrate/solute carrier [Corchorus olitorius]
MAMFPVDTVKTHMQAFGSCPIKSVGVRYVLSSILKSEGIRASIEESGPWVSGLVLPMPSTSLYTNFARILFPVGTQITRRLFVLR